MNHSSYRCRCCNEEKPVTEFARSRVGALGHQSSCKSCLNAKTKRWKKANAEHVRDYQQQWRKDNAGILRAKRQRKYAETRELLLAKARAWYCANADKKREYSRRYRKTHASKIQQALKQYLPEYSRLNRERLNAYHVSRYHSLGALRLELSRAHARVLRAVASGALVRPSTCEECGREAPTDAAHRSYAQGHELDVRWLCRSCHVAWDRRQPKLFTAARKVKEH